MKLYAPHLAPGETMITTAAEYMTAYQAEADALQRIWQHTGGRGPERDRLDAERQAASESLSRREPYVLVSICPFCATPVWYKFGVFSLLDTYWYSEEYSRLNVPAEPRCPHLFSVDGALNLNGHQPTEVGQGVTYLHKNPITIAAEVPFVKTRVLNLPTMVAVIHCIPIAEHYTGFPVVYFTQEQPPEHEFCLAWAKTAYLYGPQGITFTGRRRDAQQYDLRPWIKQRKVFWLSKDETQVIRSGHVAKFPYGNVRGRKHPYSIKNGCVYNLPDPKQGKLETETEAFLPYV